MYGSYLCFCCLVCDFEIDWFLVRALSNWELFFSIVNFLLLNPETVEVGFTSDSYLLFGPRRFLLFRFLVPHCMGLVFLLYVSDGLLGFPAYLVFYVLIPCCNCEVTFYSIIMCTYGYLSSFSLRGISFLTYT